MENEIKVGEYIFIPAFPEENPNKIPKRPYKIIKDKSVFNEEESKSGK